MNPAMNPTRATTPLATWTLTAPLVLFVAAAEAADALLDTDEAADEADSEAADRMEVVIVACAEVDDIMELEVKDAEEENDDSPMVEFEEVEAEVELPPETSMPVPQGMAAPVPGCVEFVGSVVDPSAAAIWTSQLISWKVIMHYVTTHRESGGPLGSGNGIRSKLQEVDLGVGRDVGYYNARQSESHRELSVGHCLPVHSSESAVVPSTFSARAIAQKLESCPNHLKLEAYWSLLPCCSCHRS